MMCTLIIAHASRLQHNAFIQRPAKINTRQMSILKQKYFFFFLNFLSDIITIKFFN